MEKKFNECGVLVYNSETEEGEVSLTREFNNDLGVVRLDVLKDWIDELTNIYNDSLDDFTEELREDRRH
jgi:hypothetical protein